MAPKKGTGKKTPTKGPAKVPAKTPAKPAMSTVPATTKHYKRPCTLDEICKYLSKDLADWLTWFWNDYKKVRKALCNVERQAFGDGTGVQAGRFCTGGGPVGEPADPVTPPGGW